MLENNICPQVYAGWRLYFWSILFDRCECVRAQKAYMYEWEKQPNPTKTTINCNLLKRLSRFYFKLEYLHMAILLLLILRAFVAHAAHNVRLCNL